MHSVKSQHRKKRLLNTIVSLVMRLGEKMQKECCKKIAHVQKLSLAPKHIETNSDHEYFINIYNPNPSLDMFLSFPSMLVECLNCEPGLHLSFVVFLLHKESPRDLLTCMHIANARCSTASPRLQSLPLVGCPRKAFCPENEKQLHP